MTVATHPKWKICLVGSSAVGKTSLIRRFVVDEFDDHYLTTLGTKVTKKTLPVTAPGYAEPVNAVLAIWDIMGQPSFVDLLKDAFFTGAQGVLAVADFTKRSTLTDLDFWVRKVSNVAGNVPVVIAVNKSDLILEAEYDLPEVRAFAAARGCEYFTTSAKTGENVEQAFQVLADVVARRMLVRAPVR